MDLPDLNGPISATILFTVGTIAVDSLSSRWGAEQELAAQTERTELERARRAVLEERTRIARELHDVVAHHMSLIAVQAETAPYRLSDLPESAVAEFGSLSGVAREALAEMRRLLGVLRYDQPAGLAPQPQLSDLPALVDAARRAGVSVELAVPGAMSDVPSGVRCARTGSCRNRCRMPASTRPERRSACRWAMTPGWSCCGWPTGPGPAAGSARPRGANPGLVTG